MPTSRPVRSSALRSLRHGAMLSAATGLIAACGGGDDSTVFKTAAARDRAHAAAVAPPPAPLMMLAGEAHARGNLDGPLAQARFDSPSAAVSDGAGNVYIADYLSNSIRKIDAGGVVSTIAGSNGVFGSTDGPASTARLSNPRGLARDRQGNLYFSEQGSATIRRLSPDAVGGWVVTTIAGKAFELGATDGIGQGARFSFPAGLAYDATGYLYVADTQNYAIRRIRLSDAQVETYAGQLGVEGDAPAGSGVPRQETRFRFPVSVGVDAQRNLFVADSSNCVVQMINAQSQLATTVAGKSGSCSHADGEGFPGAGQARLAYPQGVAVDKLGRVLIADTATHTVRALTIDATKAVVGTVAGGANTPGYVDGPAAQSRFEQPVSLHVTPAGDTLVMEGGQGTLRRIVGAGAPVVSTWGGARAMYGSSDGQGEAATFRSPSGIALAANGELIVADASNYRIRAVDTLGRVRTVAGSSYGYVDGPLSSARFQFPIGVASAPGDIHYVVDDCVVRKIEHSQVSTVAGKFGECIGLDGAPGAARLSRPTSIAVEPSGTLVITENEQHTLRRISADGSVQTVAGKGGECGFADGEVLGAGRLCAPRGAVAAPDGTVFVLDAKGLRRVAPGASGGLTITTLAINPTGTGPRALAIDAFGKLYASFSDHTIRVLNSTGGDLAVMAGTAGTAGFVPGELPGIIDAPRGLAVQADAAVLFSTGRGIGRIRPYTCEPGAC
jgi:sugar lactone lactonase YvrE